VFIPLYMKLTAFFPPNSVNI